MLDRLGSPTPHSEGQLGGDPRGLVDEPRLPAPALPSRTIDAPCTLANLHQPPANRGKFLFAAPKREARSSLHVRKFSSEWRHMAWGTTGIGALSGPPRVLLRVAIGELRMQASGPTTNSAVRSRGRGCRSPLPVSCRSCFARRPEFRCPASAGSSLNQVIFDGDPALRAPTPSPEARTIREDPSCNRLHVTRSGPRTIDAKRRPVVQGRPRTRVYALVEVNVRA